MRRLLFLVLLAGACDDAPEPPARVFASVAFDTLWTRGGVSDTILEIPLHMTADAEYVFVADGARKGIAALRAEDGGTEWVSGWPGSGPGEFRRPAVVEVLADGRLAIADTELSRLAFLDRDGGWIGHHGLEEPQVGGLCGLADGSLMMTLLAVDSAVVRTDAGAGIEHRERLPWPEMQARPTLLRQAMLRHAPDRRFCILAMFFGPGLAIHDGSGFTRVRPYVEQVPLPDARTHERRDGDVTVRTQSISGATVSARAMAVSADRIYVQFDGLTEHRGRLVDVYTLDGVYLHSLRFGHRVQQLAAAGDVLYLLSEIEGIPTLTAIRPRLLR